MKVKKLAKVLMTMLCCLALTSAFALSACGNSTSSDTDSQDQTTSESDYKLVHTGVLTVATSPYYAPMEYLEGGEIKGYDIALIMEVANRLGLIADIQSVTFDTLIGQVASGKTYDCAISAIPISNESAEQVAFTDPYFNSDLAIVVMSDSAITSRDQIDGKAIGAISATTGEEWVASNLQDSQYTPFQEPSDLFGAVRIGTLSAAVIDKHVAEYFISSEYDDCEVLEIIPTGEQYGIIVNTANVPLAVAINDALAEMLADGTIAKLRAEWFGEK